MVAHERLDESQAHEQVFMSSSDFVVGGHDTDSMRQSVNTRAYPEVVLANKKQAHYPSVPLKEQAQHLYQQKLELNAFSSLHVQCIAFLRKQVCCKMEYLTK